MCCNCMLDKNRCICLASLARRANGFCMARGLEAGQVPNQSSLRSNFPPSVRAVTMGVPKFYHWLSERYPTINQAIGDSTLLPEFDNLYLDMNGIIHNSTHGNGGMNRVKGEHEVALLIIAYIDRILKIVKPAKVLYLAVDGVAPRAKMNQQRSRRFRAARDMAEQKAAARAAGESVNDDEVCAMCLCVAALRRSYGVHFRVEFDVFLAVATAVLSIFVAVCC